MLGNEGISVSVKNEHVSTGAHPHLAYMELWINRDSDYAILYSICALYLITKINNNFHLDVKNHVFFTIILMFIPYVLGTYLLISNDLDNAQTGLIVGIMWLTIVYMILPVAYQLIKKLLIIRA